MRNTFSTKTQETCVDELSHQHHQIYFSGLCHSNLEVS